LVVPLVVPLVVRVVVLLAVLVAGLLAAPFPVALAVAADFLVAPDVADFAARAGTVVPVRAVDRAAGAAADRAADVVRPAWDEAGLLVAAMAYRPLPG